jgi:hypothetical protein
MHVVSDVATSSSSLPMEPEAAPAEPDAEADGADHSHTAEDNSGDRVGVKGVVVAVAMGHGGHLVQRRSIDFGVLG